MKTSLSCKTRQLWRTLLLLPLLVFALSISAISNTALAVHDTGLFELDTRMGVEGDQAKKNDPVPPWVGDANTTDEPGGGDDWATIYADYLLGGITNSGAFAISFIEDTFANNNINNGAQPFVVLRTPEVSFFTGGGSKDTNGIQDGPWLYDTVSDVVPDKNDIVNAFAAAYEDQADGRIYFYFGLDTLSVNGAANAGFWFFRDRVGLAPLAAGQTKGSFVGEHTNGDIFVAVAYTQGGRVGTIQVYKWVGDDATGSLVLQPAVGASCADAAAGDDVCGVINKLFPGQTFGEDPEFDYANTLVANNPGQDSSYQYESAALVEFGLDVTELLGQEIGCFTTFLAETRSSQSKTAQLKDFAFGEFPICGIEVDKTGETPSKVGDDINYEILVTNTGMATLYKQSILDSLGGDLSADIGCGDSLAAGASCTISYSVTVQESDPDPLENEVTVIYTEFADPASLEFSASDIYSVDVFQPSIALDKTGDDLSKVGDDVNYTITLDNTSSADTPDLDCTITDSLLGVSEPVTLAAGGSHEVTPSGTIPDGASDPYTNTASVECLVTGFSNVLDAEDSYDVNLFQPAVSVVKSGDTLSKVGDSVDYSITVTNDSSADSPDLVNGSISDTLLGDLLGGANPYVTASDCGTTLATGSSCTITASRTVQEGDDDPLPNTVSVSYNPDGFPNDVSNSDDHSVNLFQPAVSVIKTGDMLSKVGDSVDYSITITNDSSGDSPDLVNGSISDTLLGDLLDGANPYVTSSDCGTTLATGSSCTIMATRTVQEGDADPLPNTVSVSYNPDGFPNVVSNSDDHSVNLFQPSLTIDKDADCDIAGVAIGENITYSFMITNTSSADTPTLNLASLSDTVLGDLKGAASVAGCDALAPSASCNFNVVKNTSGLPVGPLDNTVTANYHPDGFPNDVGAEDSHSCDIILPAPARVVIEKVLLNAEGLAINYSDNNLTVPDGAGGFALTPLFAPVLPQSANSPFPAAPTAGNSFATTIELVVEVPDINDTVQSSVSEDMPLPANTNFVGAQCAAAVGGNLSNASVVGALATLTLGSGDFAFCRYVNEFVSEFESCTPGYWKQDQHFGSWIGTGYSTGDSYEAAFGVVFAGTFSGITLLEALNAGGNTNGEALLRHSTAALLNSAKLDYPLNTAAVIALVSAAWADGSAGALSAAHTELAGYNETYDCPLGRDELP